MPLDIKLGITLYTALVRTNLIARVSHIPGHEIHMVSYALWDGGDCLLY